MARRILETGDRDAATVIVVNGWSPPDIGVAATMSARTPRSVVLYTRATQLPGATSRLLGELPHARVVIVGGTAAVRPEVEAQIRAAVPGGSVERVSGPTRTGTAAGVARHLLGPPAAAVTEGLTIVAANGWSSPDIGVAAALSARTEGSAVLYIEAGRLSLDAESVLRDYGPARVIFIGGPAAITREAMEQARSIVPGATVIRLSGATRTQTAAAVARRILGRP